VPGYLPPSCRICSVQSASPLLTSMDKIINMRHDPCGGHVGDRARPVAMFSRDSRLFASSSAPRTDQVAGVVVQCRRLGVESRPHRAHRVLMTHRPSRPQQLCNRLPSRIKSRAPFVTFPSCHVAICLTDGRVVAGSRKWYPALVDGAMLNAPADNADSWRDRHLTEEPKPMRDGDAAWASLPHWIQIVGAPPTLWRLRIPGTGRHADKCFDSCTRRAARIESNSFRCDQILDTIFLSSRWIVHHQRRDRRVSMEAKITSLPFVKVDRGCAEGGTASNC